jgi:hypothetical protein
MKEQGVTVKNQMMLGAILMLATASGCAARLAQVTPGMTSTEVRALAEEIPNRVQPFPDNYQAWYFGDDECVLFQNDKVVGKDETRNTKAVHSPEGGYMERTKAQCLPPGYWERPSKERYIRGPLVSRSDDDDRRR